MSNFSVLPVVNINRSKFRRNSQHKTSFTLGSIVPIYLDEVLPGDTRKLDLGALIRMSTPIAPVMDNIYLDIYAFFVPNRLTWSHWKEFMGENNSSAGIYSGTAYKIPTFNIFSSSTNGIPVGSVGHHYGLPVHSADASKSLKVSCLPIRGYRLIYNRWFRDQNVIAPLTVNTGDTANSQDRYDIAMLKAAKKSDYFTRALPYAQKGAPVSIPVSAEVPVKFKNSDGTNPIGPGYMNLVGAYQTSGGQVPAGGKVEPDKLLDTATNTAYAGKMIADLNGVTLATINQLRFAFQYQKMLEKDAMYGSRYWEILKAHFGVVAPDSSLQDPQYLGHMRIDINIDQVVQTTGINQATPSSNELGATAAVSVTGKAGNLFTFSATEHGYIHILAVARHDQTYSQGIEKHWSREERTDFYFPVFANLGNQPILNKEIFAVGNGASGDDMVFGFQEAWAEYRYKASKATGLLDPSVANSLGYWTLTNNFGALPTLGQTFIEQDRNAISRVLQTGASGPDFIADFAFSDIAVRPMPLYSVPGLIDHH